MEKGEAFSSIPPSDTPEANSGDQVHKPTTARPTFLGGASSFIARTLDGARTRVWKEKPFDEGRYREVFSAAQAINQNYGASPAELHAMFAPIARNRKLLRQSLGSPEHFGTTMEIITALQRKGGKPEIYNFTSNFLLDNLKGMGEAMRATQDPQLIQKAVDICFSLSIPVFRGSNTDHKQRLARFLLDNMELGLKTAPDRNTFGLLVDDIAVNLRREELPQLIQVLKQISSQQETQSQGRAVVTELIASKEVPTDITQRVEQEMLVPALQSCGIDYKALTGTWARSTDRAVFKNLSLKKLFALEGQYPGIAKVLFEEFGIAHFDRYPDNILVDMFNQKDVQKPYGIVLAARYDPVSIATMWAYTRLGYTLAATYHRLKQSSYGLRIYEFSDKQGMLRALLKADRKYGQNHKIAFVIGVGHGSPNDITLGAHGEARFTTLEQRNVLHTSDLTDEKMQQRVKRLDSILEKDANIVLVSCETGADEGIAQTLSSIFPTHPVMAPATSNNVEKITPSIDPDGKVHLKVDFLWDQGNAIRRFLAGRKI